MIKSVFIVGPTASGKTSLSIELAKIFDGEIVSADSMQIYRKMDIGTAKPSISEMQGIPHYMIDVCDINDKFSVAEYKETAKKHIFDIASRGKLPIIVGGTGLYVDTLINNTDFAEHGDSSDIRQKLQNELLNIGKDAMYQRLREIDPQAAAKLHPNDTKRVLRAIECYELTGATKSESDSISHNNEPFLKPIIIGLNYEDRQVLYDRINKRVDRLIELGLVNEVKTLLSSGISRTSTAFQAIGYKEIVDYVNGLCELSDAVDTLKMSTRRYAKRQLTWFRRNQAINWINVDSDCNMDFNRVLEIAKNKVNDFLG